MHFDIIDMFWYFQITTVDEKRADSGNCVCFVQMVCLLLRNDMNDEKQKLELL